MAEVQIPMALGNRIIFVGNVKAKLLSHRGRAPCLLRIAPIDSREQITELGRGDRHRAVSRARSGSQSLSSCRCDRTPAIPARRSQTESCQRLKPTHDPQQGPGQPRNISRILPTFNRERSGVSEPAPTRRGAVPLVSLIANIATRSGHSIS